MKLFCSTAITGEDEDAVARRMRLVADTLEMAGHEAYCQSLDPRANELREQSVAAVMHYALEKLTQCDGLVVVVTNGRKSEGMLMEVGRHWRRASQSTFFGIYLPTTTLRTSPKLLPKFFDGKQMTICKLV